MKTSYRPGIFTFATLVCTAVLTGSPVSVLAMQEGFHIGLSVFAENLDATLFKTTDNTHPMNSTPSSGRSFHVRDSDSKTTSGFGVLAGYTIPLSEQGLFLSGEIDFAYHGGKARGRLRWIKDSTARESAGSDPDWPQSGESWPDNWTFEKDYSYGLTLRLGGQLDFLASALGAGSGLYLLAGIRRTEAEYFNSYEGCPSNSGCPNGREDESYVRGFDRTDKGYTAWTAGIGLHTPIRDRLGVQVETYYTDYDKDDLLLLDNTSEPYIRVPHALDAEEVGMRLRLLRHF